MKLLGDFVALKLVQETRTPGGLYVMPQSQFGETCLGEICASGPDCIFISYMDGEMPPTQVWFEPYAAKRIQVNKEDIYIVSEKSILAIVD
jgi:co-chaperonin GroES (HSP10)